MLPDDIPYRTRKPKLLRKIDPVPHVGFHRQLGEVWGKFVMRVLHVNLILNEVVRTLCLADIMVIGTHSGPVSYTHLRAHETDSYLVCRLLLEKKNKNKR